MWPLYVLLGIISLIDLWSYRIPDVLILGLLGYWMISSYHLDRIFSLLLMLGLVISIKQIMEKWKGYSLLGWGDVKLMACCALFLPPYQVGYFLIASGLCGISLGLLLRLFFGPCPIPFAPAIFAGMVLIPFIEQAFQTDLGLTY